MNISIDIVVGVLSASGVALTAAAVYFLGLGAGVVAGLASIATVCGLLLYRAGAAIAVAQNASADATADLDAVAQKKGIDDETAAMSDAALDADNARWMRK